MFWSLWLLASLLKCCGIVAYSLRSKKPECLHWPQDRGKRMLYYRMEAIALCKMSATFPVQNNAARAAIGDRFQTGSVPKRENDGIEGLDCLLIGDSNTHCAMLLSGQVQVSSYLSKHRIGSGTRQYTRSKKHENKKRDLQLATGTTLFPSPGSCLTERSCSGSEEGSSRRMILAFSVVKTVWVSWHKAEVPPFKTNT